MSKHTSTKKKAAQGKAKPVAHGHVKKDAAKKTVDKPAPKKSASKTKAAVKSGANKKPLPVKPAPAAKKKAREVLDAVGMGDRWNDRPGKLSGGQQQRIAIARALVHEPPLVICDEPTAALDAMNGEIVLDLFRQVARAAGRAVIIVTHDNRIFSYADRIARMDDGCIIEVHRTDPREVAHFEHEVPH